MGSDYEKKLIARIQRCKVQLSAVQQERSYTKNPRVWWNLTDELEGLLDDLYSLMVIRDAS